MRPDDVASQVSVAARLFDARDYGGALHALEAAAEARPDDPDLIHARAICLASLSRYREATALCDRLIVAFRDVRGVSIRARIAARMADAEAGDDAEADLPFADELPFSPDDLPSVDGDDDAPLHDREPDSHGLGAATDWDDDWDGNDAGAEAEWEDDDADRLGASVVGFDDAADDGSGGGAPQAEAAAPSRRRGRGGRIALMLAGVLVVAIAGAYGVWRSGLLSSPAASSAGARTETNAAGAGGAARTEGDGSADRPSPGVDPSRPVAMFPSDRVLGELDVRAADASDDAPWRPFAMASGAVAAPDDGLVCRLRVAEHHWLDLQAAAAPELPLVSVHIANSEMTDAVLDELELFADLRELVVEHAHQLSDDGLARLARVPELASLVLRGTHLLSDDALRVLAHLPALRRLDVAETTLGDRAMAYLEPLKALETLELPEGTGDITLGHAAAMARLKRLSLGRNVTDEGLSVIGALPRLRRLRVTGALTAAGVAHLMALSDLEELEWRGALDVKTADALRHLPRLGVLRLTGTELAAGVLERLAGAGELREVELAGVTLATPSQFAGELRRFAQEATGLRGIVFRNMELPRGALASLAGHGALTRVDLRGSTVASDDIAALGGVPGLREVNLASGARDGAVAVAIGDLTAALPACVVTDGDAQTPRRISFPMDASRGVLYRKDESGAEVAIGRAKGVVPVPREAEVILDTTIEGERDLSFLRLLRPDDLDTLRLPCGAVPPGELQHLVHLSELRALAIAGMSIDDDQVVYLEPLSGLEGLSLAHTALTDAGVSGVVRAAPGLTRLDLSGCDAVTDAAVGELTRLAALESLDLRGTAVTDAGLSGLRVLFALRQLDVRGAAVTAEGVESLRMALPECEILSDTGAAGAGDATPAATAAETPELRG